MLRAIIIDDEKDAVTGLSLLLQTHCPEIAIAGKAYSVKEGIDAIRSAEPDIIFLDIEMPPRSGFDILKHFKERAFKVIFTTAYDHYAIKAIKFSAFDYLLKPIDANELCQAVDKAKKNDRRIEMEQRDVLFENLGAGIPRKLALPMKDGFLYVPVSQIIRIEGMGSYCAFFTTDRSKHIATHNIGFYDGLLRKSGFYRVHQSHLINLEHVHQYLKADGGIVVLSDKSCVPISRRNKEGFLNNVKYSG